MVADALGSFDCAAAVVPIASVRIRAIDAAVQAGIDMDNLDKDNLDKDGKRRAAVHWHRSLP